MKTLSYKSIRKIEITEFDFPNKMNWEDAKTACESIGSGWRLPTKEEMKEIYECYFLNGVGNFSEEDKYWLFEHNTLCWFGEEFGYYAGYEFKTKFEKHSVRAIKVSIEINI